MRILLINPPLSRLKEILNDYFPLGLGYLAAVLRPVAAQVMIYNAEKGPEEQSFASFSNLNRIITHQKYVDALKNDQHYVWKEVARVIKEYNPDLVGISSMSTTFPSAAKVAAIAKQAVPRCKVVLGGPHPTCSADEVLKNKNIDFVVRGEGEDTIVELVKMMETAKKDFASIYGLSFKESGRSINNKDRKLIEDLDKIPFPARDLIMFKDLYLYPNNRMNSTLASRGCPFKCTFCQARFIWGERVRFRSVENVITELKQIVGEYKPDRFTFWDDSFTVSRKFVMELCKQIEVNGIEFEEGWNCETRVDVIDEELLKAMKKAGCREVYIGIESGSKNILREIKKNITVEQVIKAAKLLKKIGFSIGAFFMIGFPQESEEDIELTKKLMAKVNADQINLCVFTPYPGSELYNQVVEMGLFPEEADWSRLSHQSPENYFTPLVPREKFKKIIVEVAKYAEKLNNRPSIVFRRAFNKKDIYLKNPKIFFRGLVRNLKINLGLSTVKEKK